LVRIGNIEMKICLTPFQSSKIRVLTTQIEFQRQGVKSLSSHWGDKKIKNFKHKGYKMVTLSDV